MNKFLITLLLTSFCCIGLNAQSYNQERTSLTNFLMRMYENSPFDGVKVVNDYDSTYLISVIKLDSAKYQSESALNRVASIKAKSQASRFFNGSNITEEMIIRTTQKENGTYDTETTECIRENSTGFVKNLEQLINFRDKDGEQVFIFITPMMDK